MSFFLSYFLNIYCIKKFNAGQRRSIDWEDVSDANETDFILVVHIDISHIASNEQCRLFERFG